MRERQKGCERTDGVGWMWACSARVGLFDGSRSWMWAGRGAEVRPVGVGRPRGVLVRGRSGTDRVQGGGSGLSSSLSSSLRHPLGWVVDTIVDDQAAGLAMVRGLVRGGAQYDVDTVERAFDELCERAGASDALYLFEELQQQQVFRNSLVSADAYVKLILGLAEEGNLEHALNVGSHWFASVHKGYQRMRDTGDEDGCAVDGDSLAVDEALVLAHATVGDLDGVVEELDFMVNVCRNGDILSPGFLPAVLGRLERGMLVARQGAAGEDVDSATAGRAGDPAAVADAAVSIVRLAVSAGAYPLPEDAMASLRSIFQADGRDINAFLGTDPEPLPPAFPAVRGGVIRR